MSLELRYAIVIYLAAGKKLDTNQPKQPHQPRRSTSTSRGNGQVHSGRSCKAVQSRSPFIVPVRRWHGHGSADRAKKFAENHEKRRCRRWRFLYLPLRSKPEVIEALSNSRHHSQGWPTNKFEAIPNQIKIRIIVTDFSKLVRIWIMTKFFSIKISIGITWKFNSILN